MLRSLAILSSYFSLGYTFSDKHTSASRNKILTNAVFRTTYIKKITHEINIYSVDTFEYADIFLCKTKFPNLY